MRDELAIAAHNLLDYITWPDHTTGDFVVPLAALWTLRHALKAREAVDLWKAALALPCPKCGSSAGVPCFSKNTGRVQYAPHKQRMRTRCVCGHQQKSHGQDGQCTYMESDRKICRCQFFVAKPPDPVQPGETTGG